MLISLDWINEFVNIKDLNTDEIAKRFTLGTAEIEEVKEVNSHLLKIVVAEITSIEKHPQADKLNLVTFNYGASELAQVVCGAGNVEVGKRVPYAPVGTSFPGGFTLVPKEIRGILSEGMLCSEEELGLAQESAGLLILPDDAPLGMPMNEYLNMNVDIVIDVDNKSLTHRPDLWGMVGLAREFAAITDRKLKDKYSFDWEKKLESKIPDSDSPISVVVEQDCACLGYLGLSVDNVKVTESPVWLKNRLNSSGLRPINSIVDISNYVMLELGIPLHIFDRERISGDKIIIKKCNKKCKFVTLDEVERDLEENDTVVSDNIQPLVIAGVMGGESSSVTESTNKIFIEVANWNASSVRKLSTRLGLRTDSSQRYEKSLDSAMLKRTLLRTLELILDLNEDAKVNGKLSFDGLEILKPLPVLHISVTGQRVREYLGKDISTEEMVKILTALDFKVVVNGDLMDLVVPTYRSTKDIESEADIVEEIGRIIGYDNITPISPKAFIAPVRLTPAQKITRKIREFVSSNFGAFEVYTYPLVGKKLLEKASWNTESNELVLVNALSNEADRMRPSIVPSVLNIIGENLKHQEAGRIFEIGRSYTASKKDFSTESTQLIVASFSQEKKSSYLDLANMFERLKKSINLPADIVEYSDKFLNPIVPNDWVGLHPFEKQSIRVMGKMSGAIFSVHPLLLKQMKIKGSVSMLVVDLSMFEKRGGKDRINYKPLSKFPEVKFDCSVVVSKSVPVSKVVDIIRKQIKLKEFKECKIVTTFDVDSENISLTLRTVFAADRTLDAQWIKDAELKVVSVLSGAGFPLKS